MRDSRAGVAWESWRVLLDPGPAGGLSDGPLLERFATRRGEAAEVAFAALVARHGPMVRRVCRTLLGDPNDADDAFQATFLVLARKAGSIRKPERLAGWLHGTALRASKKLKVESARRAAHEARRAGLVAEAGDDPGRRETAEAVLEELARLPESCRAAAVLCDLDGLTHDEAARRLGWSDRTLRRRLARARGLLRDRLTRRGLAPAVAPILSPSLIPETLIDATARAASRFAAGTSAAGTVPASVPAVVLAEGVIAAMTWTKFKGIVATAGLLLAVAVGVGIGAGLAGPAPQEPAKPQPTAKVEPAGPSPAEQFQTLAKRHAELFEAYSEAVAKATEQAERLAINERLAPKPPEWASKFIALAERYPNDPVAVDALLWVLTLTGNHGEGGFPEPVGRAMTILVRDHADDPRLGPICFKLTLYPSPRRDAFLPALAEKSRNRTVKGQATLALAQYLKMKGELLTELPPADPVRDQEFLLPMYGPAYLQQLRSADPAPLLAESNRVGDRVIAEFGDLIDEANGSREPFADVARRLRRPKPPGQTGPSPGPTEEFKALVEAFRVAEKAQDQAEGKGVPSEATWRAHIAAAPKWADHGPKFERLALDNPRHPAGLDALLWIIQHATMPRFFDAADERAAANARAVDALIRDHFPGLAANLARREVAQALNHGDPFPAPPLDGLLRALHEMAPNRDARGRAGLMLARYFRNEADLADRLPRLGPERAWYAPAYLDRLRLAGPAPSNREAEALLARVIADHGDVRHVNGTVLTDETLATVAGRDLDAIRNLAIGRVAPEIVGEDVEGRPLKLSDFRGKVVLLDFGSHEHCGGCRLLYPAQRDLVARLRDRPFALLGINNHDRRDVLKQEIARGEITWRCWYDSDKLDAPGPITARWNVRGYPTFLLLDHKGVIRRARDLNPLDPTFGPEVEALVKQAEADARP